MDADQGDGDGMSAHLKGFSGRGAVRAGSTWFQREYVCEFRETGSGLFAREVVERAFDESVGALDFGSIWKGQ